MKHFVERKFSYVELVSTPKSDQTPNYFVSHWWGESVLRFVACVLQHAFDRRLSEDTTYWICAYSLNQHKLKNEMGDSLVTTPFFKAMQLTKGTLSVLDGRATCYNRLWCAFEISIVLQHMKNKASQFHKEGYQYGMYAISEGSNAIPGHPVGLTDGLVAADFQNYGSKSERESEFPMQICNLALSVQLEKADVSVQADRAFILNNIVGQVLTDTPPECHKRYDFLNLTVRARFAEATYSAALKCKGTDITPFRRSLSNGPLTQLTLNFFSCTEFQREASNLMPLLPTTLTQLEMILGGIPFENDKEFAVGIGNLVALRRLVISLGYDTYEGNLESAKLKDMKYLSCELGKLRHLEELNLSFRKQMHLSSIEGLADAVGQMRRLRDLFLELDETGIEYGYSAAQASTEIESMLNSVPSLRQLHLEGWMIARNGQKQTK